MPPPPFDASEKLRERASERQAPVTPDRAATPGHEALVHVDILDGRFWIQYDGTESGVANDLVDAGVPRDRIVLAFHPPTLRGLTGFAG